MSTQRLREGHVRKNKIKLHERSSLLIFGSLLTLCGSLLTGRHAHATWGRHELTPRGELTRRHEVTPRGELTRRHEVTPSLESRELTRQVEQVPGHDVTHGVSPVARGSQVAQVPGHDATHPQPKPPVNDVTRRQRRARSPATEDQLADDQVSCDTVVGSISPSPRAPACHLLSPLSPLLPLLTVSMCPHPLNWVKMQQLDLTCDELDKASKSPTRTHLMCNSFTDSSSTKSRHTSQSLLSQVLRALRGQINPKLNPKP